VELVLTADGELVAAAHRELHDEMDAGRHDLLPAYAHAELQVVARVLRDLLAATQAGVRTVRHSGAGPPASSGDPPATWQLTRLASAPLRSTSATIWMEPRIARRSPATGACNARRTKADSSARALIAAICSWSVMTCSARTRSAWRRA